MLLAVPVVPARVGGLDPALALPSCWRQLDVGLGGPETLEQRHFLAHF
jgi:hypothetical protein